jgi:hypothetical protein
VAFEYQVIRSQREIVDAGYWVAGRDVPAYAERGVALLVIDEEIADGISRHLDRFRRDLVGAGWRVVEQRVPRHRGAEPVANLRAALAIRGWIMGQVAEDPFAEHALILVGHVPVLRSGQAAPDGHEVRPHPTDSFYADIDSRWTGTPEGLLLHNTVPGNGIELQVGRIDFGPMAGSDREREIRLLQQYFDKNHHWRHGLLGDLRNAYANERMLQVEEHGLFNLVGAEAIAQGGHHDAGAEGAWLWGVDFGSWNFDDYFEQTGGGSGRSVFAINFGSNKQIFDAPRNPMTALLAQPWHTVAVGWGARPAWRLHLMALGGTIGEVHRRSLNNGPVDGAYPEEFEYVPTGQYVFRQPVWVNLLGDPTLGAYPLAPPGDPVLQGQGAGAVLTWEASPDGDTRGYRVFRLAEGGSHAEPVGGTHLLEGGDLTLEADEEAGPYLVRSFGLKETPAGSFYTYSQGAYVVPAGWALPEVITIEEDASNREIFIPLEHTRDGRSYLVSIVHPPATGRIAVVPGGWRYTPAEAEMDILLPIAIFDGQVSRLAQLEIRTN